MDSEDLVSEVFTYFTGKVVHKFRLVSKGTNGFADDSYVIRKQCQKMQSKDDLDFILQPHSVQRYNDKVELHSLDHTDESFVIIPPTSLEFLNNTCRVLASSNGLLICRDVNNNKGSLLICNPLRKTWCPVPSSIGLGPSFDYNVVFECSNIGSTKFPHDYLLMIFIKDVRDWDSNFLSKVYVPEEGIWKENNILDFGKRGVNFEMPVFHYGAVHFVSDWAPYIAKGSPFYWPYIISLNLRDGTLKKMSLPKNSRKGLSDLTCRLGIFKWGSSNSSYPESICLVKVWKKKCCVWFLSEYNKCSWTWIMKKRLGTMGFIEANPVISGFTVLNGKSLLLATEDRIYRYDLTSENEEKVKVVSSHECGEHVFFHSYSSTLRPCGHGAQSISSL